MDQINNQFLMRHLALSELIGGEIEEFDGGCRLFGGDVWVALWQPEVIPDIEVLLNETIAAAAERALQVEGIMVLSPPETAGRATIKELEETCYLMGFPRTQGINLGGPDIVQILKKPPTAPAGITVTSIPADSETVARIAEELSSADDRIDSPVWVDDDRLINQMEAFLATSAGKDVGLLCLTGNELVSRICVLWVDPDHREAGTGQALIASAAEHGVTQGKLLTCTWTHREGRFRYFFNKMGFEDSLSAMYYMRQS